jgi:hypothetical protein
MMEYASGSVHIPSINVDDVPRRVHIAVKANPAATISATLSHRAILPTYQKATNAARLHQGARSLGE